MSMGMMMLSPVLVSLPFKIMLFVVVDGWTLLIGTLGGELSPMTPENVMDLAHSTLLVTSMIAAPLLLTALVTGLVIGMLQAATQINEATLSFIPKLLVLVLALFVSGPWILRVLIDFTRDLYASIPSVIG